MKHKIYLAKAVLVVLASITGLVPVSMAEKQRLKLQAPQNATQEREDYQECLTAVIRKYSANANPKALKKQQGAVAACRDRYPAAFILAECKKQMTEGYKEQLQLLKPALKECHIEYKKYSYNPKNPVLLAIKDERAFFAGVGMNEATVMKVKEEDETPSALYMGENFGNFSCTPLYDAMFRNAPPEYTLFGNDPFVYSPLRNVAKEAFFKSINYPSGAPPLSFISKDFGEITFDKASGTHLSYLPSSSCFFNRKIGNVFEGIKIYYLLDRPTRSVIPYFGVGFYAENTVAIAKQIAEEIRAKLGNAYQTNELKPGVFIVATHANFEVDAEGDPKNLCQKSAESPYVAIVFSRESSNLAAYSLFANTGNLCRFGDRIASRFLKKKSLSQDTGVVTP